MHLSPNGHPEVAPTLCARAVRGKRIDGSGRGSGPGTRLRRVPPATVFGPRRSKGRARICEPGRTIWGGYPPQAPRPCRCLPANPL